MHYGHFFRTEDVYTYNKLNKQINKHKSKLLFTEKTFIIRRYTDNDSILYSGCG